MKINHPDYWEIDSWDWWAAGYGPVPEWLLAKGKANEEAQSNTQVP